MIRCLRDKYYLLIFHGEWLVVHVLWLKLHLHSLLYMVGLCCDWLKSVTTSDYCVWSGEMLTLKVPVVKESVIIISIYTQILYVVSLRLYYHYLVGRLTVSCTQYLYMCEHPVCIHVCCVL